MITTVGLDVLARSGFDSLRDLRLGVLCNQASVDHGFHHLLDHLMPMHQRGDLTIAAIFGPQHGLAGTTQDNMIEWEGTRESGTEIPIYSLYGEVRKPTPEMLRGIEHFLIDVFDVGSRYYTFIWTMALAMEACAEAGIPLTVLDRPNPIGGIRAEGPVLDPAFSSFVGLRPLPTRHGMTAGEVATYLRDRYIPNSNLTVIRGEGWSRASYLDEIDAPWAMPSPNMPAVPTAVVYPGGCLLEATNLSEGRGTTRPFEMVGAPFLNGERLAASLNARSLPGVHFRPVQFEPTFNKHAGKVCEGVFIHVLGRHRFEPVLAYVALLQECLAQTGLHVLSGTVQDPVFRAESAETQLKGFAWRLPPYEYEAEKAPIDILAGNDWLREAVENRTPLDQIREKMRTECEAFEPIRSSSLLYR